MKRNPLEWVSEVLVTVTAIPILMMMVHVTLDVTLKYIFNMPIQGTLEITANYYMVAIVVLPMASVEMARQSIAVDLFYLMMPRGGQVAATGLVLLICAVAYGGLGLVALEDAIAAYNKNQAVMGTIRITIWPARFLLPLAFIASSVVCLYHLARFLVSRAARDELTSIHPVDPEVEVA